MFKGMSGLGDMAKMMKQAQDMQGKMAQMQDDLHNLMVAKGELKALDIDPSIFNGDDKEVVEDLILAAIKDAQQKANDRAAAEMQKMTEDLGLPPGMNLPF